MKTYEKIEQVLFFHRLLLNNLKRKKNQLISYSNSKLIK